MTAPSVLRIATPADAALLSTLHVRSRQSAYRGLLPDAYLDDAMPAESAAHWSQRLPELAAGDGQALVAEIAGEPVGFVCMSVARPPEDARTAGHQAEGCLLPVARPPEDARAERREAEGCLPPVARPPEDARTAGRQAEGCLLPVARPPEDARTAGSEAGSGLTTAPDAQRSVYIENLHVLPGLKGGGLGTRLLDAAAAWARAQGAAGMHLLVFEDNRAAIGFYEAKGWRRVGRQDDGMGGHARIALVYAIAL